MRTIGNPTRTKPAPDRISLFRTMGLVLSLALTVGLLNTGSAAQNTYGNPRPTKTSIIDPAANRIPDKNQQMEINEKRGKTLKFEAANAERKRQLDEDSERLLQLAVELNQETERSPERTLSQVAVRKAEEIERLAHNVQQKMKLTMGAN